MLIKQAVAVCHADLEALLLLCGDFVLTQVSNADDQNVVFHLLRLPTMPVTLDDQRKRQKKRQTKRQQHQTHLKTPAPTSNGNDANDH